MISAQAKVAGINFAHTAILIASKPIVNRSRRVILQALQLQQPLIDYKLIMALQKLQSKCVDYKMKNYESLLK